MNTNSLKNKVTNAAFWSFLQKIGSKGIGMLITVLLARILTPSDFGLIGMIMIFIYLGEAIMSGGFKIALIQKKDADEIDYSSVFYLNLIISFCFYFLLFVIAPLIADFYEQHILINLIRVLGLFFIINSFALVQETKLEKELNFKILMFVHLPSIIIAGIVSLLMAYYGYGVWSIIAMHLVNRLCYAIQIWFYSKWKPLWVFNKFRVKSLFDFGGKILIAQLLGVVFNNIYVVVIGKLFPVKFAGYYQNAFYITSNPSGVISSVINSVSFPAFSAIQDDDKKLKSGYQKVIQQVFFWICPIFLFAGILAEPIFKLIFNEKWLESIPYFQWLCVLAVFQPLYNFNINIANIKGRSDLFLKLQLIRRGMILIGILIVIFYKNIQLLLAIQAILSILTYILFSLVSGRLINYSLKEQVIDLLPTLILCFFLGVGLYFMDIFLIIKSLILRLTLDLTIIGILYLGLSSMFNLSAFKDMHQLILNKIRK